jgi:cytoskeleton protein RodZ
LGTFGDKLRREREMRGVSLDEIATATKIGTRSLKALENEDFSKLPGGIFNKGFVRAYAKFLGINEDQAVADYVIAAGEAEQNSENVMERIAAESERRENEKRIERAREESAEPPFTWNTIAIVVVLAVAGVLGWQYYSRNKALKAQQSTAAATSGVPQAGSITPPSSTPSESATAVATTPAAVAAANQGAIAPGSSTRQVATVTPVENSKAPANAQLPAASQAPAATNTSASASKSPNGLTASTTAPAQEFVVVVKTTKESWVSSRADNKSEPGRLLAANSEATFRARNHLQLSIGNAGGVEVSFNGNPMGSVGKEGEVKTLVFTPEGPRQ